MAKFWTIRCPSVSKLAADPARRIPPPRPTMSKRAVAISALALLQGAAVLADDDLLPEIEALTLEVRRFGWPKKS